MKKTNSECIWLLQTCEGDLQKAEKVLEARHEFMLQEIKERFVKQSLKLTGLFAFLLTTGSVIKINESALFLHYLLITHTLLITTGMRWRRKIEPPLIPIPVFFHEFYQK